VLPLLRQQGGGHIPGVSSVSRARLTLALWASGELKHESKKFFFEKKNQKTFAPLRAVLKPPGAKTNKVFLLLFVHKKKCFLVFLAR